MPVSFSFHNELERSYLPRLCYCAIPLSLRFADETSAVNPQLIRLPHYRNVLPFPLRKAIVEVYLVPYILRFELTM